MDKQKLLYSARSFGAEARANLRSSFITKDDREDLAHTTGVAKWGDIPEEYKMNFYQQSPIGIKLSLNTGYS